MRRPPAYDDEGPLAGVRLTLARGAGDGPLRPVAVDLGGVPRFEVGDRAELTLENVSATALHVALVETGVDGAVSVLFPVASEGGGSALLTPGEVVCVARDAHGEPEGLVLSVPEGALAGGDAILRLDLWLAASPFDALAPLPPAEPPRASSRPGSRVVVSHTLRVAPRAPRRAVFGDGAPIAEGPLSLVVSGWLGEARFDAPGALSARSAGGEGREVAGVALEDGEAVHLGTITLDLEAAAETRSLSGAAAEPSVEVRWRDASEPVSPVLVTDDGPEVTLIVQGERDADGMWRFAVPPPEDEGPTTRSLAGVVVQRVVSVFGLRGRSGAPRAEGPSPDDCARLAGGGLYLVIDGRHRGAERSAAAIRRRYLELTAAIPPADQGWAAAGLPTCDRARRAFAMRRDARLTCRALMESRLELLLLQLRDLWVHASPNGPSFESLLERMRRRGREGEDACAAILASSTRSNARVNRLLGVTKAAPEEGPS